MFGQRSSNAGRRLGAALSVLVVCVACGKKGPPLAPRDLSPAPPAAVLARRLGDRVYLTFKIPNTSARGSGPYSLDHLDVFAVTIAPGHVVPPNRDLLMKPQVVGTIPVRQIEDEEELEAESGAPTTAGPELPKPGEETTFVETLADAQLQPRVISKPEKQKPEKAPAPPAGQRGKNGRGRGGAGSSSTGAAGMPVVQPGPAVLSRYYVIRGVTKQGKPGGPSLRVIVPLLAAPEPPRTGPSASWDATTVTILWDPPPSRTDEVPGVQYNVYAANANAAGPVAPAGAANAAPVAKGTPPPPLPLNPLPIDATSFTKPGADADKEQCFVVRSVAAVGVPPAIPAIIESDPSAQICVTPKDTFPPDAPKSLAAVASAGVINLIWDANVEADLAGYLVLRGDAPGATLQPLMREPIKDTRYGDRTAKPGVRYVYAIIAVDKAGNRSAPSNRVEDAAR